MVINFDRTAAYRCPSCGEIAYGDFSIFELSGTKAVSIQCACGQSNMIIAPENKNNFSVSLQCIVCDEVHKFSMPFQLLTKKDCIEFACPNVVVGLVFIGRNEAVRNSVLRNEQYVEEVIAACGLGHTGKNGVTMLKALDKIQDLSDNENLYCECGSNMIDVEVRENDLVLECCQCGTSITLSADAIRNSDFSHLEKLILKRKK